MPDYDRPVKATVTINPLAQIAKQMGLTASTIKRETNLAAAIVHQCLCEPPESSLLAAYIYLFNFMGIRFGQKVAKRVCIAVDIEHLDSLYFNESLREKFEFRKHPRTQGEMRKLIRYLRSQKKPYLSLQGIARHLDANYICTAEGHPAWRHTVVATALKSDYHKKLWADALVVTPNASALKRWRDMLVQRMLLATAELQTMPHIRYGIIPFERDGKVWFISTDEKRHEITEKPREWFVNAIAGIPWLRGAWTEMPDVPSFSSDAALPH